MSEPIIVALIAAIPPTLVAGIAVYMAIKTHRIVNGGMLIQLQLHAKTARALANSKLCTETQAIAEQAEKMLKEHQDKLNR